jgi:hypothetical protein
VKSSVVSADSVKPVIYEIDPVKPVVVVEVKEKAIFEIKPVAEEKSIADNQNNVKIEADLESEIHIKLQSKKKKKKPALTIVVIDQDE